MSKKRTKRDAPAAGAPVAKAAGMVEIGPAPGISSVASIGDGNRVVRLDGPPPWTVSLENAAFLRRHRPHLFVTAAEWRRHQAALAKAAEAAAAVELDEGKGGGD